MALAYLFKFGSNLLMTSFNSVLTSGCVEKFFEYWSVEFKKYVAIM